MSAQIKMVIVMRKFPGLRTGEYCAQAAHATQKAMIAAGWISMEDALPVRDAATVEWLGAKFTKVVVYVKSAFEILELEKVAKEAGLATGLVEDAGLTEFNGVKTITALGIGPAYSAQIDPITRHLPLF